MSTGRPSPKVPARPRKSSEPLATARLRATGLVLATVLLLATGLVLGCGGSQAPLRMQAGVSLPEFTLPALDGTKVSSASFGQHGEVTVLNFWATWCQPCLKEMPELAATATDPRVQVVGVALDEEGAAAVAPFVERHGIDFPILLGDQAIFQRLGGHSIPYTLVLDSSRKVVNVYRGPTTGEQLEQDISLASTADGSDPTRVASKAP